MLTWPHGHGDWLPYLKRVEPVFIEIAFHIARFENVIITCWDAQQQDDITAQLRERGTDTHKLHFYRHHSNDTWARDHGPITVIDNGRRRLLDFGFNGWGNKFAADLDDQLSRRLHSDGAFGDVALETIDLILEGGSIDSDGLGSLLTTSVCLLSKERNPQLTREQIETRLKALFGLERILWLEHGYLAGDDTDSHIDTLARFCSAHSIAYMQCDDPADEHYRELSAMEQELRALRDLQGQPYELIPLPLPRAIHNDEGRRLPASYANFLIINDAVLVPIYADPTDEIALQRLRPAFPDRELIPIECRALIEQFGSLHCVTMQIPSGGI
jgi:agmatine deiminase